MSTPSIATIATMGIDLAKNSFPIVGLNRRRAAELVTRTDRSAARAMPPCLRGGAPPAAEIRRRQDGRSARIAGTAPVRERLVRQHTGTCLLMRTQAR
jgi:hypothetical protein